MNGYGFRNWSTDNPYFETPSNPERGSISEHIRDAWHEQAQAVLGVDITRLPEKTVQLIAQQARTAVVQRAGTNGHCYGMVLSAQQYYEQPATIPVNRPTASDIEAPTVPVEEPESPVYDDIVQLQAAQFLRFRAWLGRRALFYRDRIDTRAVLSDLRAAVDTFGTATIILFNNTQFAHQVLVYDIVDTNDNTVISIYDPNRAAPAYGRETRELRFDRTGETATMEPYGKYTGILYNAYDRIEQATGRSNASPLDHLTVGRSAVTDELFPLVSVTVDSEDAALSLVGPNGTEGSRIRGQHMDCSRGNCSQLRSIYGASPGKHKVRVFGASATDYELHAVVTGLEETQVDATQTASIEAGGFHEYELQVPENGDGVLRRRDTDSLRTAVIGAAGTVGALAAGTLGYKSIRRARTESGGNE